MKEREYSYDAPELSRTIDFTGYFEKKGYVLIRRIEKGKRVAYYFKGGLKREFVRVIDIDLDLYITGVYQERDRRVKNRFTIRVPITIRLGLKPEFYDEMKGIIEEEAKEIFEEWCARNVVPYDYIESIEYSEWEVYKEKV